MWKWIAGWLIDFSPKRMLWMMLFKGSWWQGITIFNEGVQVYVFTISYPEFSSSLLLSSSETASILPFSEGTSAWIIWLCCYWCIKLHVWFLSRPCHQSQFDRALAECNISLIRSTRKLRRWTVLIREEIIKLGAPGIISPSKHYCKPHKKSTLSSLLCRMR